MFKRISSQSSYKRVKNFLWPDMGWRRYCKYIYYTFLRLEGSGHNLACGFAWGAAASFTPFMGLHILIGCFLSKLSKGNMLAAAIGTLIGNPLTFPFFWSLEYSLGRLVLGQGDDGKIIEIDDFTAFLTAFFDHFYGFIFPMIIGGFLLMPVVFVIFYFPIKYMIHQYRLSKKKQYHT